MSKNKYRIGDKIEQKNAYTGYWEECTHYKHGATLRDLIYIEGNNQALYRKKPTTNKSEG